MATRSSESFGDLLASYRKSKGLAQKQLAKREVGLSSSYIAMIESGKRGLLSSRPKSKPLMRDQVWHLVQTLELWPPDLDRFLECAGHSSDRSEEEEIDLQRRPIVKELWVFARKILDPSPDWCKIVADNLLRGASYLYFTSDDAAFHSLLRELKNRSIDDRLLQDNLECILLPQDLFLTNFAIYNPGKGSMYGCGTKSEHGRAGKFYSLHDSEVIRLFETLSGWRQRLSNEQDIYLSDARRIYPYPARSKFCALE